MDCRRWGFFTLGCIFMAAIFVILFQDGKKYLADRDSSMLGFYNNLVLTLIVLWTCYPIVWAFSEGTNTLSSNTEVPPCAACPCMASSRLVPAQRWHWLVVW